MTVRTRLTRCARIALAPALLQAMSLSQSTPLSTVQQSDTLVPAQGRSAGGVLISPLVSTMTTLRADWKTFGNGPSHTGYYPDVVSMMSFAPGWTASMLGNLQQVAVAEGRVFVTARQIVDFPWLKALDDSDGHVLWTYEFEDSSSINPPSFDNGHVYVQRVEWNDTHLWSFHAGTGVPQWASLHGAQSERYMAPTVADGKVWVNGGGFGGMYGFRQSDGQQLFFFSSLMQYDQWTPTYYAGKLHSWVAGVFREHDPITANQHWSLNLGWSWAGWSMTRTSAIVNGRAFVIGNPNLYAIDLSTQSPAWSVGGTFNGTPAVANGVVYALSGSIVKAYDAWSGAPVGVYAGLPNMLDQPIVTDDAVIFATAERTFVYNRATFMPVTTLDHGGHLSVANGKLYIATSDGKVRRYGLSGTPTPAANLDGDWEPWTRETLGGASLLASQLSITNFGASPSLPCRVELHLSNDTVLDASDVLLRSVHFGAVAVGERLTATVYLPNELSFANKYVLLVNDANDLVMETNENNVVPSGRIP